MKVGIETDQDGLPLAGLGQSAFVTATLHRKLKYMTGIDVSVAEQPGKPERKSLVEQKIHEADLNSTISSFRLQAA